MHARAEPETAEELRDAVGPAFGKLRRSSFLEAENPVSMTDR
ncbi:hypothetical protein OG625_18360 [Streptomyces sp. NBC_01351]|nr:hypothetical protein [Streptomyces sp. NBC_01351]